VYFQILVIYAGGALDAQYNAAVESVKQQLINAGIRIVIIDSLAQSDAIANRILQGKAQYFVVPSLMESDDSIKYKRMTLKS